MRLITVALISALMFGTGTSTVAQPPAPFAARAEAVLAGHPAFSGVVLVARNGEPVFQQAYGLANRELNVANRLDTKFRIGSITKQFTAVAILQLAEAGKLSVNDPVSKFYAEAPAAWSGITIKHLLTHTSGIPSYTALPTFPTLLMRQDRTPAGIVELTRDMPLQFQPGEKFVYNNTGYVLLGHVIEKISGQSYADYVAKNIFEPLGMNSSGYDSPERIIPNRAAGYEVRNGGVVNAGYLSMTLPHAAGSLYSTVGDLLVWERALRDGKLIGAASYKDMFTDHGNKYGYGWIVDQKFGRERIAHGGGINGFVTTIERYPKDGLVVIVLSNLTYSQPNLIADALAAANLGIEPRTATPGGETLARQAIEQLARGAPDYSRMSPGLAQATRSQLPRIRQDLTTLGALKTVSLIAAEPGGADRYRMIFDKGVMEYSILVGADGVINSASLRPVPAL